MGLLHGEGMNKPDREQSNEDWSDKGEIYGGCFGNLCVETICNRQPNTSEKRSLLPLVTLGLRCESKTMVKHDRDANISDGPHLVCCRCESHHL